jgi:hypothetical protein
LGAVRVENVFHFPLIVAVHPIEFGMLAKIPYEIWDNENEIEKTIGEGQFQKFDDVLHKRGLGD